MNTDIILINNNAYGAPELKRSYQGFTLKGFIIAVAIHVTVITAYMLFAYLNETKANEIPKGPGPVIIVNVDKPVEKEDDIKTEQETVIHKDEVVQQIKDLAALEPKPVATKDADDVVLKTQNELNNINATVSRTGDSLIASNNVPNGKILVDDSRINANIKTLTPDNTEYKEYEVEKAPECVNLNQVKSSLVYPPMAIETGQEGQVSIRVLVGEDGSVIKIGAFTGDEVFKDEVKEKAKNLQFTSGMQNNKAVKVWVRIPFNFKLK